MFIYIYNIHTDGTFETAAHCCFDWRTAVHPSHKAVHGAEREKEKRGAAVPALEGTSMFTSGTKVENPQR